MARLEDITVGNSVSESCMWMLPQQLTQAMAISGVEVCAKAIFLIFESKAERAKDLAYRLYTIAEKKKGQWKHMPTYVNNACGCLAGYSFPQGYATA